MRRDISDTMLLLCTAEEIRDCIMKKLPGTDVFIMKQVSPVLGVHTGPGTLGICVQILDEA